jgi:tritrans,polycis-undecaprenyl-diphosphate synthase [geranylgeranyl-diphosphate specific]
MGSENSKQEKHSLDVPLEKMPRHIAIILDGNRRFAKRLDLDPWKGHEYGEKKVQNVLEWCKELGIKELTLYAFSMQNFNRPKMEFDYLMNIFKESCKKLLDDSRIEKESLRIRFIGRIDLFDAELQELMHKIMEKTKNNSEYLLNMAVAYGGREEITDAIKILAQDIKSGKILPSDINDDTLSNFLYMKGEPDLIIRTGGEQRTSNFLPWQGIYSEWFFLKKHWPEFEKEDLIAVIKEYASRERRIGR